MIKEEEFKREWIGFGTRDGKIVPLEHTEAFEEAMKENLSKLATKYDEGKPQFSTVPKLALREVAKVFTYGADKYGRFNYSGKMASSRYTDAAYRHITAYETNEDIDEIGTHHLANAIASLMMCLDGIMTGQVIDDRNPVYTKSK